MDNNWSSYGEFEMADKTEIRVLVDKAFLDKLQKRLRVEKSTDIVKQALGIYDWATGEIETGRTVVSSTSSGQDVHRLVSPEFSNIKPVKK